MPATPDGQQSQDNNTIYLQEILQVCKLDDNAARNQARPSAHMVPTRF